jgi:hypothetical protein
MFGVLLNKQERVMSESADLEVGFTEKMVKIDAQKESMDVPGLIHKSAEGLAVTMQPFGCFTVTHISSGYKMTPLYERAANAILRMSEFAMVAKMLGVSWGDVSKEEARKIISEAKDKEVPFDNATSISQGVTRKMNIGEWFQSVRMDALGEFPCEDIDPFEEAVNNLESIK